MSLWFIDSMLEFEVKITVSSAYKIDSVWLQMWGRSFMYIINRRGPRMLPCGTQVVEGNGAEVIWPILTVCVLSERYEAIRS